METSEGLIPTLPSDAVVHQRLQRCEVIFRTWQCISTTSPAVPSVIAIPPELHCIIFFRVAITLYSVWFQPNWHVRRLAPAAGTKFTKHESHPHILTRTEMQLAVEKKTCLEVKLGGSESTLLKAFLQMHCISCGTKSISYLKGNSPK